MTKTKIIVKWLIPVVVLMVGGVLQLATQANEHSAEQTQKQLHHLKQSVNAATQKNNLILDDKQPNIAKATKRLNELYSLDWTIATQKEFDNKAKAMTPLVSRDVVKSSLDFKPDTDRMMTQTGVIMVFDHMVFMPTSASDANVTGKVVVFVKSHYEGKPEALTRFVYNISYNPKSNTITQLDRIGTFQLQSDSSVL